VVGVLLYRNYYYSAPAIVNRLSRQYGYISPTPANPAVVETVSEEPAVELVAPRPARYLGTTGQNYARTANVTETVTYEQPS